MLRVQMLKRRSRAFERLVGLTPDQFDVLLADLEPEWDRARRRSLLRADRIRAIGGGRTHKLELPERLLVTLLYLRQYFTVHVLGMFFDLDDSNICRNIHALLPVLEQVLPAPVRARTLAAKGDECLECVHRPEVRDFERAAQHEQLGHERASPARCAARDSLSSCQLATALRTQAPGSSLSTSLAGTLPSCSRR